MRVIDNFLDDPYSFRNFGLKNVNNKVSSENWPGWRIDVPSSLSEKYRSKSEFILHTKLRIRRIYFQWVDESWLSGLWHTDGDDYTILTFLNLITPSNTGIEIGENTITSRTGSECVKYMMEDNAIIKNSFYRSSRNYYQRYLFKKKLDKYNSSPYFKDPCVVSNKFNRTVIFNYGQLHRAQNFFGKGKRSRFTMISFCKTARVV